MARRSKRSNRQLGKEIAGLTRGGDVVAVFEATEGSAPRVWIDDEAQVP